MDNQKNPEIKNKKETLDKYLDDLFARCEMAEHTGNVGVSLSFFKGKFKSAKCAWEEGIVK